MLYQLSYEATGAGSRTIILWVHMFLWKKWLSEKKEHQKIAVDKLTYAICFICWIFLRLFQGGKGGTNSVKTEKLRALLHYFRRITRESKWLDSFCWLFQNRFGHQLCLQMWTLYITVLLREKQIVFGCFIELLILSLMTSCFSGMEPTMLPWKTGPKKGKQKIKCNLKNTVQWSLIKS